MTNTDEFFEEGEELSRPECKTISDVERVIALGKPDSVILKFAAFANNDIKWKWFDKYKQYTLDVEAWAQASVDFEPVEDEEGIFSEFSEPEPVEPIRPVAMTAEQLIAPYYKARRIAAYPELSEFADAFVKSQAGDNSQLEEYIDNCLDVKNKYPKGRS